jgi:hypothetical protein
MPHIAEKYVQPRIVRVDPNVPVSLVSLPQSSTAKLSVINGPTRDMQGIYFLLPVGDTTIQYPVYCFRLTTIGAYVWNTKTHTPIGIMHSGAGAYMVVKSKRSVATLQGDGKDPLLMLPPVSEARAVADSSA